MTFLNPLLLLAGLGVALPILAHLLNRHRVQHTPWAAMQFLDRNVRVRSRQLRLRDLLLLCLRCLALILLVFAFARPAWRNGFAKWIPGEARAGVVVGLDVSFSMEQGEAENNRFQRALNQVRVIGQQMQDGDPISIILLGGKNKILCRNMAFDQQRLDALLQETKVSSTILNLDQVPKRLQELVDDMKAHQKEVYFITDNQARDWQQVSAQFDDSLVDLQRSANLFLVSVSGEPTNLAVTDFKFVSGALRKGTIARYQATVRNCGIAPVTNVEVQCRVEDMQIDSNTIPIINAGRSETVSLFVPFHNSGPTRITAKIIGDSLLTDNERRVVAVVRDRVSVLCVDGTDGDAGRLVTAALLARGDGAQDEDYVVRSVPWLSLPSQSLDDVDVIILADLPEITPEQAQLLSNHVRQGNGLVWFAGREVKPTAWNEYLASENRPLLPAELGNPVDTSTALGAGRPLDAAMPDHPVCLPLRSLPEDLFSETRFLRRLDVQPTSNSFAVLRLAGGGGPLLLEHSLGRGHVFQFTTSADTSWNNMALTPVFPMLMQQIVTYLAGREYERPRIVGDPLSLSYVEQPDASDAVFDSPSGETISVPVQQYRNQFLALLENATEAGFYTARVSVQSPGMPVAVNVDSQESNVASLTNAELETKLAATNIIIASSATELASAIKTTRTGRSSWRYFMLAGLMLLLIETLWSSRLSQQRQTRSQADRPITNAVTGAPNA
ncbi:MAG: BatA domain-containing protein [Rubripirellula sp.]|nr:BatA domain-containing protein [Rubripirellula sp.]